MIDLILTNDPDKISSLEFHPPLGKSHHSCILFNVQVDNHVNNKNYVKKFNLKKADYNQIKKFLTETQWETLFKDLDDPDPVWVEIDNKLKEAMDLFIPKKTFTNKNKLRPPIPPDLHSKIKAKREAFKRYKKYPTVENHNKYAKARNHVKWGTRKLTIAKEKQIAAEAKTNSKAFFKYMSSKIKSKDPVSNLRKEDGSLTDNDSDKADVLVNFFTSVFTKENDNPLPNIDVNPKSTLSMINITEEDMEKALKSLNNSKSPGPDEIHPAILKELAHELASPLKFLFDLCMKKGKIPTPWKEAEVRPIFKKGDKTCPGNYRPVSLTSIVCKLFETFIRDGLYDHIVRNKLLSINQFGFCKGRSCSTQLLVTIHEWMLSLDEKIPIDAVYLDFSKAFDTVPHKRLIHKLNSYGIQNNLLSWINSFLSDRTQYVKINDSKSKKTKVISGVPQGSVLGPILFIYYINDMPKCTDCNLKMFADDSKASNTIQNFKDSLSLQSSIYDLNQWSDKWQQKFNSTKCKIMHIGKNNPHYQYFIKDGDKLTELSTTFSERDLGVIVDPNLTFEEHINNQVKKARRLSGLLCRVITYNHVDVMIPLFKSLVRPILEYANVVWSPHLRKHIDNIESVQRNFTKRIIGMKDLDYHERLKILKIPSLEFRRFRGDLIEMYKICHKLYDPITTNELFEFVSDKSATRGHNFKVKKHHVKTNSFHNFFTNRIVNPWNNLPSEIVNAATMNTFKNKVDSYYKSIIFTTNLTVY